MLDLYLTASEDDHQSFTTMWCEERDFRRKVK